jgi:hypothetical protein
MISSCLPLLSPALLAESALSNCIDFFTVGDLFWVWGKKRNKNHLSLSLSLFFFFFFLVLGFEIRASNLTITWVTPPALFALIILEIGFHFFAHASLCHNSSVLCFLLY